MEGYCVTCQKIVTMKDIEPKTLKNKDRVYEGKCVVCNTAIYKRRGK